MINREKEIEAVNAYLLMEAPYMADLLKEHRYDDFMKHLKQSETELVDIIDKLVDKVNKLAEQSEELEKETPEDKIFEELGYKKEVRENLIVYINKHNGQDITFVISTQSVCAGLGYECGHISMQELKAINKKCLELGWL